MRADGSITDRCSKQGLEAQLQEPRPEKDQCVEDRTRTKTLWTRTRTSLSSTGQGQGLCDQGPKQRPVCRGRDKDNNFLDQDHDKDLSVKHRTRTRTLRSMTTKAPVYQLSRT